MPAAVMTGTKILLSQVQGYLHKIQIKVRLTSQVLDSDQQILPAGSNYNFILKGM